MNKLMEKLDYAKDAVIWLIQHGEGDVDFRGLTYWASEVERLREELESMI